MKRRTVVSTLLVPALLALSGLLPGCGSKDKGTNVTQTTEPLESGNLGNGAVFVHTFSTAGSFSYRCRIHSVMTGVVNVAASGVDSPNVSITNNAFGAAPTVKTGSYVKWVNNGSTHTVTRP